MVSTATSKPTALSDLPLPAIELAGVGVRYRLPRGGTRSFKEFALLWLRGAMVYDEFWALRDANLRVDRGERLGVIGRNGAGKSTLLATIAQVITPTVGTVQVRGRVAPLLQLGAGFDPELTGRENVALNGAVLGMRREQIAERFAAIVDFSELHQFIDLPVRAYSSGMTARLGFSVAMESRPDVLLLDEVLSVGDEAFQAKCVARMGQFRERGTTMVTVTHNAPFVLEHCTRAVWIDAGRIQAVGAPAAVVDAYHEHLAGRAAATVAAAAG